jgi:methionyl-tRNA formyltransferase
VSTINKPGIIDEVKSYHADLGLVFGCGKIKPHLLTVTRDGLINIHRGISSEYRGLDSDLWAIYHQDYKNIGVTIHRVDEELDTGDILKVQRLKLRPDMKIHQLRYYTTLMATEMTLDVLRQYKETGKLDGVPQKKSGRYYSFMPLVLKKIVQTQFDNYTKKLI